MPTTSPRSQVLPGHGQRALTVGPVDLDVAAGAHDRPADAVVEELALGHEARPAADLVDGDPGVDEVDVADVVDREQRAAGAGEVLEAGDGDPLAERAESQLGGRDDRRVGELGHASRAIALSVRRAPRRRAPATASTSPRSSPAASTDSGTSEVSVKPGRDVDLEEPDGAVVADDQVGAGQVTQAERLVRGDGDPGTLGEDVCRQLGRDRELRRAGGVAGGVVVDGAVGPDRHCRQRPRAGAVVDHGYRHLGADRELLDQRHRAVGEGVDHRVGQLLGGPDERAAERGAAPGRLDDDRQPEPGHAGRPSPGRRRARGTSRAAGRHPSAW